MFNSRYSFIYCSPGQSSSRRRKQKKDEVNRSSGCEDIQFLMCENQTFFEKRFSVTSRNLTEMAPTASSDGCIFMYIYSMLIKFCIPHLSITQFHEFKSMPLRNSLLTRYLHAKSLILTQDLVIFATVHIGGRKSQSFQESQFFCIISASAERILMIFGLFRSSRKAPYHECYFYNVPNTNILQ